MQEAVAYLGFQKEGAGKFLLATSAYTKRGPNHVFLFFPKVNTFFCQRGPIPPKKHDTDKKRMTTHNVSHAEEREQSCKK